MKRRGRPRKLPTSNKNSSIFEAKIEEQKEDFLELDEKDTLQLDSTIGEEEVNNEIDLGECNFDEDEMDFIYSPSESNLDDNIKSLEELLGEESTKVVEDQSSINTQTSVSQKVAMKVNHYSTVKAVSEEERKKSNENIKNQILNLLMSRKNLSYIESRAELEELLKTNSLDEIRENLLIIEEPIRKSEGVYSQQFKSETKYY